MLRTSKVQQVETPLRNTSVTNRLVTIICLPNTNVPTSSHYLIRAVIDYFVKGELKASWLRADAEKFPFVPGAHLFKTLNC